MPLNDTSFNSEQDILNVSGSISASLIDPATGAHVGVDVDSLKVTGSVFIINSETATIGTVTQGASGSQAWKISGSVTIGEQPIAVKHRGGSEGAEGLWHWDIMTPDQTILMAGFTTVFELTASSGVFYGMTTKLDKENFSFRFSIDGGAIVDGNIAQLFLNIDNQGERRVDNAVSAPWLFLFDRNHFRFQPPEPIRFNSSLTVEWSSNQGGPGTMQGGVVTWRELDD